MADFWPAGIRTDAGPFNSLDALLVRATVIWWWRTVAGHRHQVGRWGIFPHGSVGRREVSVGPRSRGPRSDSRVVGTVPFGSALPASACTTIHRSPSSPVMGRVTLLVCHGDCPRFSRAVTGTKSNNYRCRVPVGAGGDGVDPGPPMTPLPRLVTTSRRQRDAGVCEWRGQHFQNSGPVRSGPPWWPCCSIPRCRRRHSKRHWRSRW